MQIQLITFEIDAKMLAVDIMAVREIRAWTPTTPIPNAPPFVRGVVNLRGLVLPVIDLSERLGWGRVEPNERNVIIVVEIAGQMTLSLIHISEPENMLEGLASVEDRMAMILKLGYMGAGADMAAVLEAA
ncbi:chemotaxis protein CheW [Blastomonas sp. CCH11-A4]|uniref:chemotaxis protein CheW n=1 Tax=Blastomonas sp. CCH11-A4 TaxID=1768782 RepID=UPI000826AE2F|nr:chemotaxis protein CheW [Blastomonas sp. CCH11-A4]